MHNGEHRVCMYITLDIFVMSELLSLSLSHVAISHIAHSSSNSTSCRFLNAVASIVSFAFKPTIRHTEHTSTYNTTHNTPMQSKSNHIRHRV